MGNFAKVSSDSLARLYRVSTHSRPKAAGNQFKQFGFVQFGFQHTAARRRLGAATGADKTVLLFQHTAARRRLDPPFLYRHLAHSSFNTQPPEGGWAAQARLRGVFVVSTHSRLKAAGQSPKLLDVNLRVSTHSRLKAAGSAIETSADKTIVSTHSRLKAAGPSLPITPASSTFQHTAA